MPLSYGRFVIAAPNASPDIVKPRPNLKCLDCGLLFQGA